MKVQLVTPYRVNLLQRYGVTVRGNVTSVYPPLDRAAAEIGSMYITLPIFRTFKVCCLLYHHVPFFGIPSGVSPTRLQLPRMSIWFVKPSF